MWTSAFNLCAWFLRNILSLLLWVFPAWAFVALENVLLEFVDGLPTELRHPLVHAMQKLVEQRDKLDSELQQIRKANTGMQHEVQVAALQRKLGESERETKNLQQLLNTAAQQIDKLKQEVRSPLMYKLFPYTTHFPDQAGQSNNPKSLIMLLL
jgi:uncharacterized membrane protein